MFFYPIKTHFFDPEDFSIKHEIVSFTSHDNILLNGWIFPSKQPSNKTIIFLHGNAGNISLQAGNIYWLTEHGFNVFIFDYRGYGHSQGEATLDNIIRDIDSAIAFIIEKSNKNTEYFVIGHSLGASMAIYALSNSQYKQHISSVILISGFADYQVIAREVLSRHWLTWALQWPLSYTVTDKYRPLDHIQNLSPLPVIIMHSPDDQSIPYYNAEQLFQKAREPKQLVDIKGGHNHIFDISWNKQALLDLLQNTSGQIIK
ncbi:MAG: alpha/beta hydrolase [Gammaproteobacteria bacterium]